MKAYARSIRIAPKKANIVAKMVRGLPVPEALDQLRRTHKKAARIIEQLVASAAANAEHNDKQDRQILVVKLISVNQGAAYNRGVPMARGRMRPMKKFLSHISVTLGIANDKETGETRGTGEIGDKKAKKAPSKAKKTAVSSAPSETKKAKGSPESPASPVSSVSPS